MKFRQLLMGAASLGLVGSLVAGCGSGAPSGTTGSANSSAAANQTLTIGDAYGDPQNFDPIATFTLAWGEIASNIFEGLVFRSPSLKIEPGLATSWHYVGKTELIFNLRKGVKFQDGEPFNANAVKFTFDRLLGPQGQKGPQYSNYTAIKTVRVLNPYKVEFLLSRPDPTLITKLAGYGAMIVPPKYIEKHGSKYFGTHPIGTGPFKVVQYIPGSKVVLQRFNGYWRGPAKLKTVVFDFITNNSTRLADLQTGSTQIMQEVPPAQVSLVKNDSSLKLYPVKSPTVYELGTDTSKYPTNNVLVRQAISEAINVPAIVKNILDGYGIPVATMQGPLSFGYDPNVKPYSYNPKNAKKLLAEAKVPKGTPLTLSYVGSDTTFQEVAQTAAKELDNIGFNVKLQSYDQNTLYNSLIPNAKAGNLYEFEWGGWTLDFDNTAELLYVPKQFWNPNYSNPQINHWLSVERNTLNKKTRQNAFDHIDEILHQQAVGVPLYDVINLWAATKNVKGFVAPPDDRLWLWPVSLK